MATPHQLCVIIPVHQAAPSKEEAISLLACYRHLKHVDCFLVFPQGQATAAYQAIHPDLLLQPVPPAWLSSRTNYNRMKMSRSFYEQFADYDFMMTYELDAYLFSPDIQAYHGFDFDFIGAPVFEGYMDAKPDAPFLGALNSGFSVRNIKSCLTVLKLLKKYKPRWRLEHFIFSNIARLRKKLPPRQHEILFHPHLKGYFSGKDFNEDMIWTQVAPALFPFFRIAPPETAAVFSFEVNPERLYVLTNKRLPLGCHAWQKFPSFWEKYIPAFN